MEAMQRTKSSWCRLPFAFFGCAVKSKRHKNLLLHEFFEASIFAKSEKLRRRVSSHLFWQIVDQSYEQSRKLGTETLIFCRLCFMLNLINHKMRKFDCTYPKNNGALFRSGFGLKSCLKMNYLTSGVRLTC